MHEFSYWVGIDTPDVPPDHIAAFNDFYSSVHLPEVLANNPEFRSVDRYELTQPDARGDLGPRWLARYTLDAERAGQHIRDNTTPGDRGSYTPFPAGIETVVRWRLLWTVLSTTGKPLSAAPERINLIGMDPAPDSTDEEVRDFNTFYDTIHVHEALHLMAADNVTRYEIARTYLPEGQPPLRFAALYEFASVQPPAKAPVGPVSDGPRAWAERKTHWRLGYTRVAEPRAV